jgi:hypothetical protein
LRAPVEVPYPHRLGSPARSGRRLVKDGGTHRARTPSIAECSLPRARTPRMRLRRRAGTRGINGSPPPVSLLARRWLSPPRPGFRRIFARQARPLARGAGELDPGLSAWIERCSSTSATQSIHEHHRGPPDPRPIGGTGPACARALRSPASKARPKPRQTISLHRVRVALPPPGRGRGLAFDGDCDQPRFHEPGPAGPKPHPEAPVRPSGRP